MSKENKQLEQLKSQVEILAEQKKIIQEKKVIAETELSIAESQKKLKEINLPKGKTKPLEGTISTDEKFGYLSELVAYHAVKSSAEEAGNQIKQLQLPSGSKILVVDNLNFAEMDFPLIQIENQFTMFENALDTQIQENIKLTTEPSKISELKLKPTSKSISPLGLIPHVPGIISLIADIAGYFKVDYNIKGQDFNLDNDAITAIITGKISGAHDVRIINFNMMNESKLLKRFDELIEKRKQIEAAKVLLLQEKTSKEAKSAILESEKIMETFDAFVTSITTAKEGQKQPLIVLATIRDYIRQTGITHLLHLKISSSGGEAITQKRVFGFGRTAFIGGGTISYILAQRDGKIISADTLVAFSELDYKIASGKSPKIRVVKLP